MSVKIRPCNVRINLINLVLLEHRQQEDFCLWALYGVDYLLDFIPDLVVVFKVLSKVLNHFTLRYLLLFS